jgi:hypothetical protein
MVGGHEMDFILLPHPALEAIVYDPSLPFTQTEVAILRPVKEQVMDIVL